MSARNLPLASFLRACRRRLTPKDVGLPQCGRRRISSLRREEVAGLADVGITWYTWLEQGRGIKIAPETLGRISKALRLDSSEEEYVTRLVRTHERGPKKWEGSVSDATRLLVENYVPGLAALVGARWDLLAWNSAFGDALDVDERAEGLERNALWLLFMQERQRRLFADWPGAARRTVAAFRIRYADYVGDRSFEDLIATLLDRSVEFASLWSDAEVLTPAKWMLGDIRDLKTGVVAGFRTVSLPVPDSGDQTLMFHYPILCETDTRPHEEDSVPSLSGVPVTSGMRINFEREPHGGDDRRPRPGNGNGNVSACPRG